MTVLNLIPNTQAPRNKSCATCLHLVNPKGDAHYWKCGISGFFCSTEANKVAGCGLEKSLWELRKPKPPGFWSRLGDALIDRIRGEEGGMTEIEEERPMISGFSVELDNDRSVWLGKAGETFCVQFMNSGVETRLKLSQEAAEALHDLLGGHFPDKLNGKWVALLSEAIEGARETGQWHPEKLP